MITWHQRLIDLDACTPARRWCAAYPATREGFTAAWAECPDARWMLWLVVRVLPRRRSAGVLVEVVRAACAHLASDEMTDEVLNPLAAWAAGASVDVAAVRERAWQIYRPAAAAAWAAYGAADAAYGAAAAAWAAYGAADAAYGAADAAYAAADDAAAHAAAAAAWAAAAYAARADADAAWAMGDVVRAHLAAGEAWDAMMGGG